MRGSGGNRLVMTREVWAVESKRDAVLGQRGGNGGRSLDNQGDRGGDCSRSRIPRHGPGHPGTVTGAGTVNLTLTRRWRMKGYSDIGLGRQNVS